MSQKRQSNCDFCHQVYYAGKSQNKKKNGFPVFLLCEHCFNWSLAKKDKKYAKILKGNFFKTVPSGKSFSEIWTSKYKRPNFSLNIGR